VTRAEPAS